MVRNSGPYTFTDPNLMHRTIRAYQSVNDRPLALRATATRFGLTMILAILASQAHGQDTAKKAADPAKSVPVPTPAPPRPPAPIYTRPPTTPTEFWDAADYLLRTGQAADAVPYLNKFLQSNPDDATLLAIRDQYGARSFLQLQDHPETRALAEPLVNKLGEASRRTAMNPDRIKRYLAGLTRSKEEQDHAVAQLRQAGPFAVPPIFQELGRQELAPEARSLLVHNMGRLDRSATPALIAALNAKPTLAADAAEALGQIGDPRAIPALTALTVTAEIGSPAKDAARRAIEQITRRPFASQPKSPVRLLADEARRYHKHAIKFPGDSVTVWDWDAASQTVAPRTISRSEAEAFFGNNLARAALAADPTDRAAQATLIGLALEKAVERVGAVNYPAKDPANTFAAAVAAGPAVLGDVLRQAVADGKSDLAGAAALALGKVTDPNALAIDGNVNPLVVALSAPGRRARFAAAKALVNLDPRRPFAGSSRVVPVLAQFVTNGASPRALVIDGNLTRGSQLSGYLKALGYEPALEPTGAEGFKTAAESADIEMIFVDHHMILGEWRLHDTLSNLRADARTTGIPVYLVAPLTKETDLLSIMDRFPGVKFLVSPTSPETLKDQLAFSRPERPENFTAEDRDAYAKEAATLLSQVAGRSNSPFERDLARIEPALIAALLNPGTSLVASTILGEVALPDAQRGLADVLIDPSKPAPLRLATAAQLAKSVQRFGPLVAADQEAKLLAAFDQESDPALHTALGTVIGSLRPKAASTGARLRKLDTSPAAIAPAPAPVPDSVPPASPSPEAAPTR